MLDNTKLKSRVILAPMAGVTDLPFRKIVREFGSFLMFSEMVASQAVIRNVKRTHKMIEGSEDEFTAIQIVGADPKIMAEAARLSYDLGAKFLDINMGCPVKKIVKSDSGSALMKNEKLAAEIIKSVVNAVPIPVTLKMRLGWDMDHKNSPAIAKIAEDLGIKMITVHGRTRSQLYTGIANWGDIRFVKDAVKIPVIANGDIINIETAKRALEESVADGIMIGRGALGRPWILREIHNFIEGINETFEISKEQMLELSKRHISYMLEFRQGEASIKMSRKILMHYCRGTPNAAKHRQLINSVDSVSAIYDLLEAIFE